MKLAFHKKRSKKTFGLAAVDIHEWIDAFFDHSRYRYYRNTGVRIDGFNPYDHRPHRHHREAEDECVDAFKDTYPEETIRAIFEQHIRDDYEGYYPVRADFDRPDFLKKYHSF